MRHGRLSWTTGAALLALLFTPVMSLSEENAQRLAAKHKHYTLIDLGPFGGPVGPQGTVVGGAPTSVDDPACLEVVWRDPSCHFVHAFEWRRGVLTDLGTLPDGNNSLAFSINSRGTVFGGSENGLPDPVYGIRAFVATIWKDGEVQDLGTLGGGLSWPGAGGHSINDRGQAVGSSMNTSPDPDGYGPALVFPGTIAPGNHWHAVLWQNGTIQDLGTLGDGLDSGALFVNQRGQVAGNSYTDTIAHPETGVPTTAPFLWENGHMRNLGSLGGAVGGEVTGLNDRGQVVGGSALPSDPDTNPYAHFHAFLWERGSLRDLGILGGEDYSFSEANAIGDDGEVTGHSHTTDGAFRGFRWKNGLMSDLGGVPGFDCSNTGNINASGQIAGWAYHCEDPEALSHAVLWEKDGSGIDLNVFVPSGSDLELIEADWINDRGEIVGQAFLPDGEFHNFLLIPGEGNAAENAAGATATGANAAPAGQTSTTVTHARLTPERLAELRARFASRHRGFGPQFPKWAR